VHIFAAATKLLLKITETQNKIADLAEKLLIGSVNNRFIIVYVYVQGPFDTKSLAQYFTQRPAILFL
jgi:hypothetical protein